MASNQQRPTDDVLGHGGKRPEDETAGDDRGKRNPDDVEGHRRHFFEDPEAVDEDQVGDDTEGHVLKFKPKETLPGDDTEGHGFRYGGQHTEATDEDEVADDVEGHGKGRAIGLDTEAIDEDAADVEGHVVKCKEDTEATDDVGGHASKVRLGQDTEAVDEDQVADDTEGHAVKYRG